jgi:hypothetical protein
MAVVSGPRCFAFACISARLQQRKERAWSNSYRTADEADRDKAHLVELFKALNASPSVLRRDDASSPDLRVMRVT